ncbi:MAG: class I SAM-dependent methyltransferase [Atopobiaceae bacterium]|jgi:16S rRNA (guanine1516-N2)-methyltransferase|nr:class I SAM-dependent methyltransferase [Atopobiaceae bacterium]
MTQFPADVQVELAKSGLTLCSDESGLMLRGDGMELRCDLMHMVPRISPRHLSHELLIKAARIKGATGPLKAVDATAGLGEDSLLLAAAGFDVTMYEDNPVIAALLADVLRRSKEVPELVAAVGRMHAVKADSLLALLQLKVAPDLIYLDPMFPARTKSAAVKKKFQLLHHLERPCTDAKELLHAALSAHPHKIVVKRPLKGPYLAQLRPNYSLKGRSIRFDVIIPMSSRCRAYR